jgi:hypothetical protein
MKFPIVLAIFLGMVAAAPAGISAGGAINWDELPHATDEVQGGGMTEEEFHRKAEEKAIREALSHIK